MKRKRQYEEFIEMDEFGHVEQVIVPDPADEAWVESRLPKGWWKHPVFDFGLHYPCPYIWFGYWLVTWEEDEQGPFTEYKTYPWWHIWRGKVHFLHKQLPSPVFKFIRISIGFLPD